MGLVEGLETIEARTGAAEITEEADVWEKPAVSEVPLLLELVTGLGIIEARPEAAETVDVW